MRVWLIAVCLAALPLWAAAQDAQAPPPDPVVEQPSPGAQPVEQPVPEVEVAEADQPVEPQPVSPVEHRREVLAAFERDPGDPWAVARRGEYYRSIGNEFLAEQDLRAALRLLEDAGQSDPAIWRELALTLEARGGLREALDAWDTAIELSPDDLSLHIERGGARLLLADQAGAEDDFRVALAAAGEDGAVLSRIAGVLEAAGHPDRALAFYQRAEAASPELEYAYEIARVRFALGDYAEASRELQLVLAPGPDDPQLLILAGRLARQNGDVPTALELLRQAIAQHRTPEQLIELVGLLTELGDPGAEDSWNALVANYPGHYEAWLARGRHYTELRRYDAAAADFARALELVPECDAAEAAWAACLARKHDIEGAQVHYRRAIDLDPSPQYYVELIELVSGRPGGAQRAQELWTELFAGFPEHPVALLANGRRLEQGGNPRAALDVYRHGAELDPASPEFPRRIGDCLVRLQDYDGAIEQYADSLDLEFDPATVRRMAAAFVESGSPVQAEAVWRSYESLHPGDPELSLAHGEGLFARGEFSAALQQFRQGRRLAPGDPRFAALSARCYMELGQPEQAVAELQVALELRADPEYYSLLARAYEQQGEADLAGRQYARGLEQFPADPGLNEAYARFVQRSGGGEALGQLEHAAGVSGDTDMYRQAAEQALGEGDSGRAEGNYVAALRANPADVEAASGLALLFAEQGRTDELLELMADAGELMPLEGFGAVADRLGAWWIDSQSYTAGSRFFEDLLERAGPHPTLYTALALLYWLDGNGATALDVLDEALETIEPTYYLAYLQAMITHEVRGATYARPLAAALLDSPELDEDGLILALDIYRELGESALRIETADRGLDIFPDSPAVYEQLALAYYYGGRIPSAIALLEDRDYEPLWFDGRNRLLGYCYLDEGNFVKAASFLDDAVRADSADAGLWAALGEARYFMGAYPEARQALTRALALDDALAAANLWLGFVLIEQREFSGARAALEGVAQSPRATSHSLAWAALGLGRVAALSGDRSAAVVLFDEAQGYGLQSPVFESELARGRAEAGLR